MTLGDKSPILPLMAFTNLAKTGKPVTAPRKVQLQTAITHRTSVALKAAAEAQTRTQGEVIDDMVKDTLEQFIDIDALIACQTQEDDNAA